MTTFCAPLQLRLLALAHQFGPVIWQMKSQDTWILPPMIWYHRARAVDARRV